MKLTIFLLLAGFLQLSARSYSQKIDFKGEKVSISKVFASIEEQTDVVFMYTAAMMRVSKPVSISVKNIDLEEFLHEIFKDQPIDYTIRDKSIFISVKEKDSFSNLYLNKAVVVVDAIRFIVRDEEGQPLEGATLSKKGFNKMGVTNKEGAVGFEVALGEMVEVSFVGYQNLVIKITQAMLQSKSYVIHLKKSQSKLDEVQITAYGKTTRRFATGSIGTVKAADIERQPVMNILQALEGRVAGLNINQTAGNAAAPIKVNIRGRNSINTNTMSEPLYVIDGVPLGALQVSMFYSKNLSTGSVQAGQTNTFGESPLFFLNPKDVESVDVLKDADATAIYGARGANGVILITTKKAKAGPTNFNLSIDRGVITIPKKVALMNTEEYLAVRNEAFKNDGIEPTVSNAPDLMRWDQTKYTDWQEYFYKPGGVTTVNGGLAGGTHQTNYRIAANYNTQEELNNNGGRNEKASVMGTVAHISLNEKFRMNFTSTLNTSNVVAIPTTSQYILTAPNAPDVYNERGEFNFEPYRGDWDSRFPFSDLKIVSESKTNSTMNNINLSYEIVKGLMISTSGGYNFSVNKNAKYTPLASSDPNYYQSSGAFYGNSNTSNWIVEPQLSYSTVLGKGQLSLQVGGSLQYVQNEGVTIIAQGFADDNLMRSPNNAPYGMSMLFEGSGEYKYNAAFAIANYRWDNKYVINLSGRRDGSSRFGPGKQFGNFGSFGVAWIASEEMWFKRTLPSWLSFVKLAGNYGITGSDGVSDYEYLTRWGTATSLNGFDVLLDYNEMPSIHILAPINQDFRWEATKKLNASLSVGVLEDKVNLELAYYLNRSGNQLTTMPTPFYTGFPGVTANRNAIVHNKGLELSIFAKIINSTDWQLSASFNIGANKNKLVDFPGLEYSPYANSYKIGKSLNMLYLYHYIGIDPMTGDYLIEDYNKDGFISSVGGSVPYAPEDDRYIEYDMNPKYSGGFSWNLAYKNFALAAGFSFVNQLARDPYFNLNLGQQGNMHVPKSIAEGHWREPGDIVDYPRYTTGSLNNNFRNSDGAYTDGSYLKLANLAFSYDLPVSILQKIRMKGCRFYMNTQNIFTITPFKGIDPQIQNFGSPIPRTITTGLNLTF